MWRKLKNLVVMDAPEWWDQPLDEFMAEQTALAEARERSDPAIIAKAEALSRAMLPTPVV